MPFFESPRRFKINSANIIDVSGNQGSCHIDYSGKGQGYPAGYNHGSHCRGCYRPTGGDATSGRVSVIGHGSYAKIVLDRDEVKLDHSTNQSNHHDGQHSCQPYPHQQMSGPHINQYPSTTASPNPSSPMRADNQTTLPNTSLPGTTMTQSSGDMSSSNRPMLSVTTLDSSLYLQSPRAASPSTMLKPTATTTEAPMPDKSSPVAPGQLTPTPSSAGLSQSSALISNLGSAIPNTHQEKGGGWKRRVNIMMLMVNPESLWKLFRKPLRRCGLAANS